MPTALFAHIVMFKLSLTAFFFAGPYPVKGISQRLSPRGLVNRVLSYREILISLHT